MSRNSDRELNQDQSPEAPGGPGTERLLLLKMWRDLVKQRWQFAAVIAVLMIGTAVFGSMYVPFQNLNQATQTYYERNRFADLQVTLRPTPAGALDGLTELRGVASVEGRISVDVPLDMPNTEDRITARLIGLPVPDRDIINDVSIEQGTYLHDSFAPQALVQPETEFISAHGLEIGTVVRPIIHGRQHKLTIVGMASTPEFIIPVQSPLDMMSPKTTFVILFVPHEYLAARLGYETEINEMLVRYDPGIPDERRDELQERIEEELDPYGVTAAVPREDQLSNETLQSEMVMLENIAYFMPIFFYLAAAMVLYNLLLRLVEGQRVQIGVLRSLGYGRSTIFAHYLSYAVLISIVGTTIGAVAGWSVAGALTELYVSFFNIPILSMQLHWNIIATAFALSTLFTLGAAYVAVRKTMGETPAELLRHAGLERLELPAWYARVALWFRTATLPMRLAVRNILRSPRRSLMTILGIVFSVALMFGTFFMVDAANYMMETNFGERQAYDLKAIFSKPVSSRQLSFLRGMDNVVEVEPVFEQAFKVRNGRFEKIVVATGVPSRTEMIRLYDEQSNPVRLPSAGIVIDDKLLDELRAEKGDELLLETITGPEDEYTVRVSGTISQLVGENIYMDIGAMQDIVESGSVMTGAFLNTKRGTRNMVRDELLDLSEVEQALSPSSMADTFEEYMVLFWGMIIPYVIFSGSLGFAIVFNTTQMNILERQQEIASMRVMGLEVADIGRMLMYENIFMAIIGYIGGLPLGFQLAKGLVNSAPSEMYHLPVIVNPYSCALIGVLILGFITLAYLPGIQIVRNMSLVEVIKVHES